MTTAPGNFGTPMLVTMPQAVQDALAAGVPFPSRLRTLADYAKLVKRILENKMFNGKVIRLDGRSGWRSEAPDAAHAHLHRASERASGWVGGWVTNTCRAQMRRNEPK